MPTKPANSICPVTERTAPRIVTSPLLKVLSLAKRFAGVSDLAHWVPLDFPCLLSLRIPAYCTPRDYVHTSYRDRRRSAKSNWAYDLLNINYTKSWWGNFNFFCIKKWYLSLVSLMMDRSASSERLFSLINVSTFLFLYLLDGIREGWPLA